MADTDTRLAVVIEANTKAFENALKRLEALTNKSFANQSRAVRSLDSAIRTMSATAVKAAAALGVAFSIRGIVDFVKHNLEAAAVVSELADKLGISAEATQELSYAAEQAGVQADSLTAAFKGMSKVITDAERGSKAAKDQLKEIGLTLADIKGKSPDQAFELIADKISKLKDPLQRTNELVKFFGKAGADLAPLTAKGAAGIDELRKRAREMGIVLSSETIGKAKLAADGIRDIGDAGQAAGIKMAEKFVPAVDAIRDLVTSPAFQQGLADTAGWLGQIIEFLAKNPELLKTLGLAAAGYKVGGPAGAAIAAIAPQLVPSAAGPSQETVLVNGERLTFDELRKRYPNGAAAGRAVGIGTSPFASGFEPTVPFMPGLAGAAKRAADARAPGGSGPGLTDQAVQGVIDKLHEQTVALHLGGEALAEFNAKIQAGLKAEDELPPALKKAVDAFYEQQKAVQAVNDATALFATTAYDAFSALIDGGKSLNDVLKDTVKALEKAAFQALLLGQGPLAGLFGTTPTGSGSVGGLLGSLFGGLFHRAGGGPVSRGMPYEVGERGRELFIPNTSGHIVAANQNRSGGVVFQLIDQRRGGSPVEQQRSQGPNGETIIRAIIRDEIATGGADSALSSRFGARPMTRRLAV